MPRTRMVKPEFLDDEKLSKISRDARLTLVGLLIHSDDYGVVKGHPLWLKNNIYPYDEIKISEFIEWLEELSGMGIIAPFVENCEQFFFIKNFSKHQKINRPSKNRNPLPPKEVTEHSSNLHEHSLNLHEDSRHLQRPLTDETETETETDTETETETRARTRENISSYEDAEKIRNLAEKMNNLHPCAEYDVNIARWIRNYAIEFIEQLVDGLDLRGFDPKEPQHLINIIAMKLENRPDAKFPDEDEKPGYYPVWRRDLEGEKGKGAWMWRKLPRKT